MEANALHDLTAAYALDALDADDARAYEAHLAHCDRCRDELASLSEAGSVGRYSRAAGPAPDLRRGLRLHLPIVPANGETHSGTGSSVTGDEHGDISIC